MTEYEEQIFNEAVQKCKEVHADPAIKAYVQETLRGIMAQPEYNPQDLYMLGWIDGTRYMLFQLDALTNGEERYALKSAIAKYLNKND